MRKLLIVLMLVFVTGCPDGETEVVTQPDLPAVGVTWNDFSNVMGTGTGSQMDYQTLNFVFINRNTLVDLVARVEKLEKEAVMKNTLVDIEEQYIDLPEDADGFFWRKASGYIIKDPNRDPNN